MTENIEILLAHWMKCLKIKPELTTQLRHHRYSACTQPAHKFGNLKSPTTDAPLSQYGIKIKIQKLVIFTKFIKVVQEILRGKSCRISWRSSQRHFLNMPSTSRFFSHTSRCGLHS